MTCLPVKGEIIFEQKIGFAILWLTICQDNFSPLLCVVTLKSALLWRA